MHTRFHARPYLRSARHALATIALLLAVAGPALAASPDLVISQVYGGGGNSGAVYTNDFIEIHNRGASAVSVDGWSVQYASATGSSWSVTALGGSIPAGGYYLVQQAAGAGGTTPLPTPDATGSIPMSATAAKVALVNVTTALSGTCPGDASIVDLVGYGSANCSETTPTGTLSNTTAARRVRAGCADTDDNAADFATVAPSPRNSASALASCQYTLDVAVAGIGSVGKSPDQAAYLDGSSVQLTATPGTGQHFVGWSGDATGNTNPLDVTMDGGKSITATFEPDQHTLGLATVGSGTVAKAPDQPTYDYGSIVQLTATPATGWHFVAWSGDATGNTNPLDVTMDGDKTITATFAIDQHTLDVTTVGSGSVAKAPDQATYDWGTLVQLTATPAIGWHFAGWSGDASGSTNPLDVTMDADKDITATFAENTVVVSQVYGGGGNAGATLTHDFIELFNRGGGAVDLSGWTVQYASATGTTWLTTALSGSIAPGGYYLVQQAAGAGGSVALPTPDATGSIAMSSSSGKVALVADAAPLGGGCPTGPEIMDFVGYGAADCSETNPAPGLSNTTAALRDGEGCEDTDDNAANFGEGPPDPRNSASPTNDCLFTLTVDVDPIGGGTVSRSPDQPSYAAGTLVQITATFVNGWHFDHWSGGATGSTNPITVPVNGDMTITAHFVSNAFAGGEIVISQVYGGGGNGAADYKHDYVELFNRGNAPVNVTGWTVQYASASGGTWSTTTLIGTIDPGRYYLVQEAQGVGGTLDLPTPDAIGTSLLGASDGKVALVSDNVVLSGNCPSGGGIVDLVGYGSANCSETVPADGPGNLTAAFRNNGGCDETDHNGLDFSVGVPAPRNSASPPNLCTIWLGVVPETPSEFRLDAPMPNPSRGVTRIAFAMPREAPVRLSVLDVQGRRVASLVDRVMPAGRHDVTWNGGADGGSLPPGLYYVRFEVPGRQFVTRVVLVR